MDGGRFDGLARALASPNTRRGYLVAAFGLIGAGALAVRNTTGAVQPCQAEGEPCSIGSLCCSGNFCQRTSLYNPNVGVCQRGAEPTSRISPTRAPNPTRTPRPTRTPNPTRTPQPTRTPRPTTTPDRSPLRGTLVCNSGSPADQPQVLTLVNEGNETVFVTLITSIKPLPSKCDDTTSSKGFRIRASRSNRKRVFEFGHCDPPGTAGGNKNCVNDCTIFEPRNDRNGAFIRYESRSGRRTLTVRCSS